MVKVNSDSWESMLRDASSSFDLEATIGIINYYRVRYHDVYARALRLFHGGFFEIFMSPDRDCIYFHVGFRRPKHWVLLCPKCFTCTCPDFFYNIVMKRVREVCMHILACLMLISYSLGEKSYGRSAASIKTYLVTINEMPGIVRAILGAPIWPKEEEKE